MCSATIAIMRLIGNTAEEKIAMPLKRCAELFKLLFSLDESDLRQGSPVSIPARNCLLWLAFAVLRPPMAESDCSIQGLCKEGERARAARNRPGAC